MVKGFHGFSAALILAFSVVSNAQPVNITGTVKRTNGTPIQGATVWLAKGKTYATTDASGVFTLSGQASYQISPARRAIANSRPQLFNNRLYFGVESSWADIQADVFNLSGRLVASIFKQRIAQGRYSFPTAQISLPAGLYCLRLKVDRSVSFFRMPLVQHQNDQPVKLARVPGPAMSEASLAKQSAVVDSLVAGCADCIASSQAIETYTGTFSFILGNASYTPPAYIQNSSGQWVYAASLDSNPAGSTIATLSGTTSLTLSNFVFLGDSVRYIVERFDTLTTTAAQGGKKDHKSVRVSQTYTDPVVYNPLSFWRNIYFYENIKASWDRKLKASYSGTPLSMVETTDRSYRHAYEIGQISFIEPESLTVSTPSSYTFYYYTGYSLIKFNQVAFDTSKIIYLPNPAVFLKDKDTTGALIGTLMGYSLSNINNYDNSTFTLELLQKPTSMTLQTGSSQYSSFLQWVPSAQNVGPNPVRVRLFDSRGYADTLELTVYGVLPSTTFTDSMSQVNGSAVPANTTIFLSKVTIGVINSSISTPKYLFEVKATSWNAFAPMSPQVAYSDFIFSCPRDSALVLYWAQQYPEILKPGTTYRAFYDTDSITIKSISASSQDTNQYCTSYSNTNLIYSRELGLVSLTAHGGSSCVPISPDIPPVSSWSKVRYLVEYNGKPFQINQITGLK